jgi:chorismate mutase
MTEPDSTLSDLRGEIDRLDDALVDLLADRTRLVAEIGSLKGTDGGPILRPGREAEILRRLLARAGGAIEGALVVRIWREIVSAAVRQQGPFSVAASTPQGGPSCWALARDQYGASTNIDFLTGPIQVAAAVADRRVTVGVVPFPASDQSEPWWPPLMAENAPKVIARLPAADGLAAADGCREGLVLALMAPEPSSDDHSLIAFETDAAIGRSNLRDALDEAGFIVHATWFQENISPEAHDGFLAEVDGFVMSDSPALAALRARLNSGVARIAVIGAFAAPLDITLGAGDGS